MGPRQFLENVKPSLSILMGIYSHWMKDQLTLEQNLSTILGLN